MWMIEYQASAPASSASPNGRSSIEPTENGMPGCSRRATSTIPGERSIPETSRPSPAR
ncbi:hypothetical protein N136_01776 [Leifsonia aquatica ATCC 14665]|uniref:Uncharacterized protein n=1 Tax=Leifsonia aquatica ATCC 14665 TaxID=1358026 RepID=U2R9E4_LEIAQ|nr:hypothetical protein N136_01776 [Leifsonia aquatica ATCC 14665]